MSEGGTPAGSPGPALISPIGEAVDAGRDGVELPVEVLPLGRREVAPRLGDLQCCARLLRRAQRDSKCFRRFPFRTAFPSLRLSAMLLEARSS